MCVYSASVRLQLVRNDRNETIARRRYLTTHASRRLNWRRAFVIRAAFRRIRRSLGFIIPLEIVRPRLYRDQSFK